MDGLEPEHHYAVKWAMMDLNGNYNVGNAVNAPTSSYDEIPPSITKVSITERTATSVNLRFETDEDWIDKIRVRYRIVGTTEWSEQTETPFFTPFSVNLTGLVAGQSYEYQSILEDGHGNQLVTAWEGL